MIPLLCLLSVLWGSPAACLEEEDRSFGFAGELRHFAVANDTVYIATEEMLYQLSHDLTPVHSVSQRGVLKAGGEPGPEHFHRVPGAAEWNATFSVNVLLPFAGNRSLISCGVTDIECGYCEVLDLGNISALLYREQFQVGPPRRSSASVSFLVTLKKPPKSTFTYILTANQQDQSEKSKCDSGFGTITLQNTDDDQRYGGVFSVHDGSNTPALKFTHDVEYVDGFQINSIVYLLSNELTDVCGTRVSVSWLESKSSKMHALNSLRNAVLSPPDGSSSSSRLVASSVIPGGQSVLWSGVFSWTADKTDTALVVFDFSLDLIAKTEERPDLCFHKRRPVKTLEAKAVLLRQLDMTSVLAVRQKDWMVFFIGTGDGQLIKLAVDGNFQTACPKVLYRFNVDDPVFPRMQLDQMDPKHVYVPFRNKMKRVPAAKCSTYTDVKECWSAQDPHCVWCQSKGRCTFADECEDSGWLSIPDVHQQEMISHRVVQDSTGQLTLNTQTHVTVGEESLACQFSTTLGELCSRKSPPVQFPQCTCILAVDTLPAEGLDVRVKLRLGSLHLTEEVKITNCSDISGPPTSVLCQQCIQAGCGWSDMGCTWANEGVVNDSVCQSLQSGLNLTRPQISSITPSVVSIHGRNHAVLSGCDLGHVTRIRMQADLDCVTQESPVWSNTGTSLTFHIPRIKSNGVVKVCALLPDGSCHGDAKIIYRSSPSCLDIRPQNTWISGGRNITVTGSHMEFVEGVFLSHAPQEVQLPQDSSDEILIFGSPAAAKTAGVSSSSVFLKVANETLTCSTKLTYYPDPEFINFTSTRTGDDMQITILKKMDKLNMLTAELSVWGQQEEKLYPCIMEKNETNNDIDYFTCEIRDTPVTKVHKLMIKYGNESKTLKQNKQKPPLLILILLVLLLIPLIIVVVLIVYRRQRRKLNAKINRFMEDLELDIRNDIRQGFVDLQTETANLMDNVGAIPFLDYKHFAARIFFPETDSLSALCVADMGQHVVKVQLDECCQGLSKLIQNQVFLTSLVHTLEEQKSFTIKDKCAVASLLTVALHGDLLYLTEVMEVLLKDLMQQSSNAQPKLLLRRTESIVEKLLTNWMSICLYGFLRESVGQHLFLMVSALTQQIAKGPVDCVTEKALYTLSEDWLLWQAPEFTSLKLKVLFAVGNDGGVSEPLEVDALSCDTVEQVKEKILAAFKAKFGFPYGTSLRDACIEYEKDGTFVPLAEVDASSDVIGEVTHLNTLKHYKVNDGATIKVLSGKSRPPLSPQGSLKDDENFSGKYFHLIDPDVVEDQRKNPERKKLKVKEVHLTKLLSTKVAVHSFVENLFGSIWGLSHSKPPHAVVYFFNFLDTQAECMKITDPDVLHIWKTNSLPLRFWINILKNPQFVFDMEKSPHLDGCLSVIAQAFMDSFSLSETQLGKYAPTNKLLYAKDIPKYKQEVKNYYKQIKEQSAITETQLKEFLREESKKHENEFNEAAALRELYKYIQRYSTEIKEKLDQNGAPVELAEQLQHVKDSFNGLKSCSWN